MAGSQDREADDAQDREGRKVNTAQSRPVTGECHGNGKDTSDAVRSDRVELRHGRGVSHVAEQSRQEERERLHSDVDCEESKGTDGVVDVEDGALDVLQLDLLVDVGAVLAVEALGGDVLLTRGQELALVRVSLHEEGSNERHDAREETLEEEDVAPSVKLHGCDTKLGNPHEASSQQTTEGACKRTSRDEDSDAEQQLVPLVKAGEEECNARHGATLGQTQEGACDEKTSVSLDECRA